MNKTTAKKLLRENMNRHGLNDWKIKFNKRVSSAGLCIPKEKTITLSEYFIKHADDSSILNTILHEIAHALDYTENNAVGHNWSWKIICDRIGCDYNIIQNRETIFSGSYDKWKYTCQGCGLSTGTMRRLKHLDRRSCRKCRGKFLETKIR